MTGSTAGPWFPFTEGNTVAVMDKHGDEVIHWQGFDQATAKSARTLRQKRHIARICAAAPETAAELERAREDIAELVAVLERVAYVTFDPMAHSENTTILTDLRALAKRTIRPRQARPRGDLIMTGWNMPPGVSECDIPGNRPEDAAAEALADALYAIIEKHHGAEFSEDSEALVEDLCKFVYEQRADAVKEYVADESMYQQMVADGSFTEPDDPTAETSHGD